MDAIHNTALILVTGTMIGYWIVAKIEQVQSKQVMAQPEATIKQVSFKLDPSDCLNQ